MDDSIRDDETILRDAKEKAEMLMARLVAQSEDLDRFAANVDPQKLAVGRDAFRRAIDSTKSTLGRLEQALEKSGVTSH